MVYQVLRVLLGSLASTWFRTVNLVEPERTL